MDLKSKWSKEERVVYKKLSDEGKRVMVQRKVKRDFEWLVWGLGYRDVGRLHEEEIKALGEVRKLGDYESLRLWLWSRGFFKTSLISEAHSVYLIINNPDIRLLITSNTIEISKKIIANIKSHFTNNEWFRYIFREWCPADNKEGKVEFGTTENFTVPNRGKIYKEPTVMVAGVGTNLTGLHFDYIKPDDLVTRDSVSNDTQIEASKDYFRSLRQLFDNPSYPKMDICGTIYHFNDLYCDLIKSGSYRLSKIPALLDGVETFPERLNKESLNKILLDIGPYEFNTQYLLNPINPKEAKLKDEWIKYYDDLPSKLNEYICVDPASTQKKRSDYTVIQRWGIDSQGNHYLLEGYRDRLTSFERIDLLFDMVKRSKNLGLVKYEVLGGRHGDLEVIKERQAKEQVFFYVKETKSTTGSKQDRIEQRLVAPYYNGNIYWPRVFSFKSSYDGKMYDFVQLMKLEYLQFPFNEHDDILDCQSQMFEEALNKPDKAIQEVKKRELTADDWEKFYKSIENEKRINPFMGSERVVEKMKIKRMKSVIQRSFR